MVKISEKGGVFAAFFVEMPIRGDAQPEDVCTDGALSEKSDTF